jgi:hypothetical protein
MDIDGGIDRRERLDLPRDPACGAPVAGVLQDPLDRASEYRVAGAGGYGKERRWI